MWDNYGFNSAIIKNSQILKDFINTYWETKEFYRKNSDYSKPITINIPSDLYSKIHNAEQKTGVNIRRNSEDIYLDIIGNPICTMKYEDGDYVLQDFIDIIDHGVPFSVTDLMSKNGTRPNSKINASKVIIQIASSIERREAHFRSCLPNLRSTAKYVVFVDRLALYSATTGMAEQDIDSRCRNFKEMLKRRNHLKAINNTPYADQLGNVLVGNIAEKGINMGTITVRASMPEAAKSAYIGKDVGSLIEGHSCSDAGLKINKINATGTWISIETNSLDPQMLCPIMLP